MNPFVTSDLSYKERVQKLAPHFLPHGGTVIHLKRPSSLPFGVKNIDLAFGATIIVDPPQGHCFIVQRALHKKDDLICSKKKISIATNDMRSDGTIRWMVKTGQGDSGTEVVWQTPHRIGRIVSAEMDWPGKSRSVYIEKCTGMKSEDRKRKIVLQTFHGEIYTIQFPEVDELLPQPDPIPNLEVFQVAKKVGIDMSGETKKKRERDAKLLSLAGTGVDDKGKLLWRLSPRDTYHMDSANFMVGSSNPRGAKGRCWYKYSGERGEPEIGVIECHGLPDFKWVYLPLTCIHQIR